MRLAVFVSCLWALHVVGQCPMGLAPSDSNLVVNGDFEQGNVGFVSSYQYCNTSQCLTSAGTYSVGADPTFFNSAWQGSDHTTGSGLFLMANGATTAGQAVWCQTVPVEQNSYYQISYYLANMGTGNPATIQLQVNGINYFGAFSAPSAPNIWVQFSQVLQTGAQTSFTICLINTKTQSTGNDFGIDDISLRKCACNLTIDAGPDREICWGDTVVLDGSGSMAYFWSPNYNIDCQTCENPQVWPQTTTVYYATVSGPADCFAIDSVTVVVHPPVDLQTSPDVTVCPGQSVSLYAEGASTYSWQPAALCNDPKSATPTVTVEATTQFVVVGTDINGCSQQDSVLVSVYDVIGALTVMEDTSVCMGRPVQLRAQGGVFYSWYPTEGLSCSTCATPTQAKVMNDMIFVVFAWDSNQCALGSDTVRIFVDTQCAYVALPTAFSPNGDGKNDFFRPLAKGLIAYRLQVFNRWGEKVFESESWHDGWDGTWRGKAQPSGTYVWTMWGQLEDNTIIERSGNVTLLR